MKISVNWLRELTGVDATPEEIASRLTGAGFEVEARSRVGGDFSGVVAVEVRGVRPHPKATNLQLVTVFDGQVQLDVVCGAPTLPPVGTCVPWARPGARIAGNRTIEARDIRGVRSPGMLCAEDELGVGDGHQGLLVLDGIAAGADVAKVLGEDVIFELNVTPNRPDCLGHRGVAREVAALFPEARLLEPALALDAWATAEPIDTLVKLRIEDPEGCPRYTARALVDVHARQSPLGTRLRLASLGIRAISDVVDATNLAMLEFGHPLHAFDLDTLAGAQVVIRRARPGETMVTLDGVTRTLSPEDVMVCDGDGPIAVAGVMGSAHSGVTAKTTRVLLETAYFEPTRVRRTARRLGLRTEASHRFERGVDPNDGLTQASSSCAKTIAVATGARIARGWIDVYPQPIARRSVTLRPARVSRVLGTVIDTAIQQRLLDALGLAPTLTPGGEIVCQVPTFRPDLVREVDLIEEIARLHGYDQIPATLPRLLAPPMSSGVDIGERARDALCGLGLVETISFGFGAPERMASLWSAQDRRAHPLRLANPLGEEQSALRTSLLPGLLGALKHNVAHGVSDIRLFEVGSVFWATKNNDPPPLPEEPLMVAAVLAGEREGWLKPGGELDFFDVKGLVESLLEALGAAPLTWRHPSPAPAASPVAELPWLHPGIGAVLVLGTEVIGALGEVHPTLRRHLDIETRAFAFELALGRLTEGRLARYRDVPRFPGSVRDLSFFIREDVPAADVRETLAGASTLVEAVTVREDYREPGKVPPGQKGMLWSLSYRAADRSLTDEEVGREHQRALQALQARFAITPR